MTNSTSYTSGSGYENTTGTTGTGTHVTGLFADRDSAERAYNAATSRGYKSDDIDVIMSDDARKRHFADHPDTELGNKAMEGVGTGSAIGGTLGAIVGAVAAIGTNLLLPGLGLVVAGPLAGALAGAGAGGLTGGIIGGLVGAGVPEERAKIYEEGLKSGNIYMGVRPRSDEDATFLENEWRQNRGQEVYR